MRSFSVSLAIIAISIIAACNISKKGTTAVTTRIAPSVVSPDGVFAPGSAELRALQLTHKEVTMQTLMEGHKLYTGVCTNCHQPKSIYDLPGAAWPDILTSMAEKASITNAQKGAIYKYILAIKATQPRN